MNQEGGIGAFQRDIRHVQLQWVLAEIAVVRSPLAGEQGGTRNKALLSSLFLMMIDLTLRLQHAIVSTAVTARKCSNRFPTARSGIGALSLRPP